MSIKIIDKGATDTQVFTLPSDVAPGSLDRIHIYYRQNGMLKLIKDVKAEEISGNKITVTLHPEETARFMSNSRVKIQMRAAKKDGTVIKSDIMTRMVDEYIGR